MFAPLPCWLGRPVFALVLTWASTIAMAPLAAQDAQSSADAYQKFSGAVALQNRGEYELAADAWTDFLSQHADDPLAEKARHYRGVCRFQLKKYADAQVDFEHVIEHAPNLDVIESTYVNLGLSHFNQAQGAADGAKRQLDPAIAAFRAQIEKFPDGEFAPMAWYYLAETLYTRRQLPESIAAYQKFVDSYAEDTLRPDALYGLGVAQADAGDAASAEKTFRSFLASFGTHLLANEVTMRFGEALFAQKNFLEAEKQFALAAGADRFEHADYALMRQASCWFEEENFIKAAELYTQLVDRFPSSPHRAAALLNAGKALLRGGKHGEAAGWFRRALASGGMDRFEASHWLARAELGAGRPNEALAIAEKALAASPAPNWKLALAIDRGDALYALPDRRGEAVGAYAEVANEFTDHPRTAEALYLAADTALAVSQLKEAVVLAARFLEKHPEDEHAVRVRHIAAEAELQLKNHAAAASGFRALLNDLPDDAQADSWRNRLALALSIAGKQQEVIELLTPQLEKAKSETARAESELLLGAAHLKRKEYATAVSLLKSAVDRAAQAGEEPLVERGLLQLARAQHGAGELAEAIASAQRLLAEFGEGSLAAEARLRLSEYLAASGDDAEALEAYRQSLRMDQETPFFPHALVGAAGAASRLGDHRRAAQWLDLFFARCGGHPLAADAHFARAVARQKTGGFDGAIEDIDSHLIVRPNSPRKLDALFVRGLCQVGKKQYADAIEAFQAIVGSDPPYADRDRALYELAWAEEEAGDAAAAVATFSRLAKEHPESTLAAECLYREGESRYAGGDFAAAAASYSAALPEAEAGPLAEKVRHKLAWSLFQQQKYTEAEAEFVAQLQAAPKGPLASDALVMRGESLFQQGKFAEALPVFHDSLSGSPSSDLFRVIALLHAGQSAGQLEKWEESVELLQRCAEEYPKSDYTDEVDYERGWAMHHLDRDDDALNLFRDVAARNESVLGARARFMMGEIQMAKKEYANAVKTLFQVAYGYGYPSASKEFHRWQSDAMFDAARCLEQLEKRPSAVKLYRELVEVFPDSEKAQHARDRLQELEK